MTPAALLDRVQDVNSPFCNYNEQALERRKSTASSHSRMKTPSGVSTSEQPTVGARDTLLWGLLPGNAYALKRLTLHMGTSASGSSHGHIF